MNTYKLTIEFYNAPIEEYEIEAESSRKALQLLADTFLGEESNIAQITINRLT